MSKVTDEALPVVSVKAFKINDRNYWIVQLAMREDAPALKDCEDNYFVWSLEAGTLLLDESDWQEMKGDAFLLPGFAMIALYDFEVGME